MAKYPERRSNDKWDKWDLRFRDSVIFVVGIAGIINELFILESPRPSTLVFLISLIGLPITLEADKRRRAKDHHNGE